MSPNFPLHDKLCSKRQLFEYVDFAMLMGNITTNTGQSWKSAAKAVLADIEDGQDIRTVDVASEAAKLAEQDSGLAPVTVRTYTTRTENLIKDYLSFLEDFAELDAQELEKQAQSVATARTPSDSAKKGLYFASPQASPNKLLDLIHEPRQRKYSWARISSDVSTQPQVELKVPFPLRHDFTVQLVLPRDMTKGEADRLCVLIQAMAQTE